MKAKVIDLSGSEVGEVQLPKVFEEEFRPDLIKRAVLAAQANRLQPYGPNELSGLKTSALSWGTGRGVSRVPRILNGRRAARVPQAKGGREPTLPSPRRTEPRRSTQKRGGRRSARP